MAEKKELPVPDALYDYILYYECHRDDWLDKSAKSNIKGDGSLVDAIDWTRPGIIVKNDKGGRTKCGVTWKAWRSYVKSHPNEGYRYSEDDDTIVNDMDKKGWIGVVEDSFWKPCGGHLAAHHACGLMLFQAKWGGFTKTAQKNLLNELIEKADKKDYKFKSYNSLYYSIADATNAYSDPLVAYDIIRRNKANYSWNISTYEHENGRNVGFRIGWMRRILLGFTPYGLYVDTITPKSEGMTYESTVEEWEKYVIDRMASGKPGHIKLLDWGASPESVASRLQNSSYYPSGGSSSGTFSGPAGGTYGGMLGGVYKLGDYSKNPDMTVEPQQNQKREEVFKTLKGNSYLPDQIIECSEFITDDKKKGVKTKSKD